MARIGALEAGGTKMVLSVGTDEGTIEERVEIPTEGPADCVGRMLSWFADRGVEALGIGAFGPTGVNPALPSYGRILETPKTAWRNFDLLGAFRGLGVPVGYDTDVNAACLGEVAHGAARGLDDVVYVTVGTGIGAGVMVGGRLLHGMLHAEAGHIPVRRMPGDTGESVCPYHDGCLEGLASGPSIRRRWGRDPAQLASRPEVWELESDYLAEAVATYVLCYSPQRVVLGGGVMRQAQLFDQIREKVARILNGYLVTPRLADMGSFVVGSGCGGDQGVLGCIELGRRALGA